MHKTKIGEAEVLSNGFDAGKYDGTYAATSFDKAWRRRSPSAYERVYPIVYKAAYLLGFHTGFANDEISWPYEEQVIEAEKKYGARMRKQNIAVEKRSSNARRLVRKK